MTPFMSGFADELMKTAGVMRYERLYKAYDKLFRRASKIARTKGAQNIPPDLLKRFNKAEAAVKRTGGKVKHRQRILQARGGFTTAPQPGQTAASVKAYFRGAA